MELREICRRFIGDRLLENIGDDDLLEVTENNISYIHSDILIPLKYVDLYKWYGYLRDLLESDVNLLSKIIFLNDMLKTTHFMYKWATYKINPKFKRNMYNVGIDKLHLVVETNLDIKPSDYALSIKFLVNQEYLNDIIDEYCSNRQYHDLLFILKDSCTNKVYNEILKILGNTMKVSKYKPTLKHSDDRLEFLMTLSDMCKLHDMKIEYNNLTLRLEDWIGIILINRTLLHPFVENLINTYK